MSLRAFNLDGVLIPSVISFDVVLEGKRRTVTGASSTTIDIGAPSNWTQDVIDVEGKVVEKPAALPAGEP